MAFVRSVTERADTAPPPAVTGFVTFALGGLYFALIPGIVIRELHQTNIALGGGIVFELGAGAAAGRKGDDAVRVTGSG